MSAQPAAVPVESGPDAGAPWHYGDPYAEQRSLAAGTAAVDLSHRPVVRIAGQDRLTWLHALTSPPSRRPRSVRKSPCAPRQV